jgi:hypothetical protein
VAVIGMDHFDTYAAVSFEIIQNSINAALADPYGHSWKSVMF